jgi:hypothetical protein
MPLLLLFAGIIGIAALASRAHAQAVPLYKPGDRVLVTPLSPVWPDGSVASGPVPATITQKGPANTWLVVSTHGGNIPMIVTDAQLKLDPTAL